MTEPYNRELDLLTVVLLVAAVFGTLYPTAFVSAGNLRAVFNNLAFDGLLAVGMMPLMVAGMLDLSVGAMASMTGVVCGWLMVSHGWPAAVAVPAALAVAAGGGPVNGLLVTRARVNAVIATLGTLGIFPGVAVLVGGPGVTDLPSDFTRLGQTEWLGLRRPVWVMLGLGVVGHLPLQHSGPFRRLYFVGANPRAARLSGIAVDGLHVLGFTLMGLIAGSAGVLFAARVGTAVSTAGVGAELRDPGGGRRPGRVANPEAGRMTRREVLTLAAGVATGGALNRHLSPERGREPVVCGITLPVKNNKYKCVCMKAVSCQLLVTY